MTTTSKRLSVSLLVMLAACTFELSPSGPPADPVPSPSEPENGGDEGVPDDIAFSIYWTEVADAPVVQ